MKRHVATFRSKSSGLHVNISKQRIQFSTHDYLSTLNSMTLINLYQKGVLTVCLIDTIVNENDGKHGGSAKIRGRSDS